MGELKILMNSQMDTTVISNQFIDKYMPSANGEYVKVYLFVLRSVNHSDSSLSIDQIAKKFDHTVSYVMTALKYWANENVLHLNYSGTTLSSIEFLDLAKEGSLHSSNVNNVSSFVPTIIEHEVAVSKECYEHKSYSADEKDKFLKDDDFAKASFVTQTYFKRVLGPTQMESLIFIYDQLGFDSELIDYLIEYCISHGKRSMRYVEAVAIEWKKQGIDTLELAKATTSLNSRIHYGVIKAFGISNRSLVEEERNFIDKWLSSYKMPEEIILEACRRTIKSINKPEFAYADSILSSWCNNNVKSLDDVHKLDAQHLKLSKQSKTKSVASCPSRDYDMDDLEKKLIQAN